MMVITLFLSCPHTCLTLFFSDSWDSDDELLANHVVVLPPANLPTNDWDDDLQDGWDEDLLPYQPTTEWDIDEEEMQAGLDDGFLPYQPNTDWDSIDEMLANHVVVMPPDEHQAGGGGVDRHVTVTNTFQQYGKSITATVASYNVKFRDLDDIDNIDNFTERAFDHVLDKTFEGAKPNDCVGLEIRHPGLNSAIKIPFSTRHKLDGATLMREIARVQQSNEQFNLDDAMVW